MSTNRTAVCLVAVLVAGWSGVADAQHAGFAANVVVPQSRVWSADPAAAVQVTSVDVDVSVIEQSATTRITIHLRNPTRSRQEAEIIFPVPDGAVIKQFTFAGSGDEISAKLLPADEARKTYDQIVAKYKDPALLEFVGLNVIRSAVFPVEAGGTQKLQLTYETLLTADGQRVDYVLPRTESVTYAVPWTIDVSVRSKRGVSTLFSPSHQIETRRVGPQHVAASIAEASRTDTGAFRLSYLVDDDGVNASLFAYPDPKVGGGYFLLLAGLPADIAKVEAEAIQREVTLVIDRSGSMNGEKLEQVREAALQVIAGLSDGETFNIIVYNERVELFAEKPVVKSRETEARARAYLKGLTAGGGTNIHDALLEALRQKPAAESLPIVLFLTDGLPTIGQTNEVAIRNVAAKANRYDRRVFTFGVGVDVNTPLLQNVADETRGRSTIVLPKEDVELKVAGVFKRLHGPVLSSPTLRVVDKKGKAVPGRSRDLMPATLPDLFDGDQLVLVGQYVGEQPMRFALQGNYLGKQRTFQFEFSLDKATTRNAFVPRLWASRKIGELSNAIRQLGAEYGSDPAGNKALDARVKELTDSIVQLSTEFGILTEYTAFLALEGTEIADRSEVLTNAVDNFRSRAIQTRGGYGSVNQDGNNRYMRQQTCVNLKNGFWDANMNRVEVTTVQQINDRAFYRRGNRWIDSSVIDRGEDVKPDVTIKIGSEAFRQLVEKLAKDNRNGCVSLEGEVLLQVGGKTVLVH